MAALAPPAPALRVPPPASLSRRTALSELRALLAVAHREWLGFVRYPSWIVGMFIWPIIFPAVYILSARALAGPDGSGLALFIEATGTRDYIGYIVIGTTVWMWQNITLWSIGLALRQEQLRGTLETNWLSPAWRFSFLLGASLTQAVMLASFVIASALEFGLLFGVRLAGSPLLLVLVWLAAMPAIYGLGLAFASLVLSAKEPSNFVFLVRGLVMIFSGVTFPIAVLPGWMQWVAAWLPTTYVIRAMRAAALGGASLRQLWPDLAALLGFGALWLVAGYLAFIWLDRRTRQAGTLGQY
jgi:ABC-2 type transport system permease protein